MPCRQAITRYGPPHERVRGTPKQGHRLPLRLAQLFARSSSGVLPEAKAALNQAGRLPMPPQVLPLSSLNFG